MSLRAEVSEWAEQPDGVHARVRIIEPNGDAIEAMCICRGAETEITGDGEYIDHLNERYGEEEVCMAVRRAVLGEGPLGIP